jgi:hypothetical protein
MTEDCKINAAKNKGLSALLHVAYNKPQNKVTYVGQSVFVGICGVSRVSEGPDKDLSMEN